MNATERYIAILLMGLSEQEYLRNKEMFDKLVWEIAIIQQETETDAKV